MTTFQAAESDYTVVVVGVYAENSLDYSCCESDVGFNFPALLIFGLGYVES